MTLSPEEQESVDRREALQAAVEQLSYLSPQTIESVMSTSAIGILDPPEIFRRAYDAAERGLSSLSKTEAQELKALQSTMLAALEPSERARVQRYDLARARLVTLPFEDREMLGMFVRRASALEASARARLQVLSGKAIGAGLAITAETTAASR